MKILLLLIISMTILITNPLSIDALPGPLKQIRDGILLDDILCREGHVLVQRTNGKIACVSEKTVLKTGWDIMNMNFNWNEFLIENPVEWSDESLYDDYSSLILKADWRNGVTTITQDKNILISSNGIPENDYSDIPNRNPHEVTQQTFQFKYPLHPQFVGDQIPTRPGPIGMTLHGAVFFNQFDRDRNDANTRERFDSCNGHANAGGIYHYHQISACFEDSESGHSKIFGFVFDGFPIYGFNGTSGIPPTDLDECNGHSDTGEYHYHATKEYPYLVGCFNGIKQ